MCIILCLETKLRILFLYKKKIIQFSFADEMLMNQFLHYDSDELNAKIKMLDDEEVICPICKVSDSDTTFLLIRQGVFCLKMSF